MIKRNIDPYANELKPTLDKKRLSNDTHIRIPTATIGPGTAYPNPESLKKDLLNNDRSNLLK